MKNKLFNRIICTVTTISMLAAPVYSLAGDLPESNGSNEQIDAAISESDEETNDITEDTDDNYDPQWYNSFDYTIDEVNQKITLNSFDDSVTEIEIPAKAVIDGKSYDVWLGNNVRANIESGTGKNLFNNKKNLEKISLEDGVYLADGEWMFSGCENVSTLELGNVNTSAAKNMSGMFFNCNKLKKLDLSSFDTSGVTDIGSMFNECFDLQEVNLSSFDTSNVTDMGGLFSCCTSLEELNLRSFNTSRVLSMMWMFSRCESLKEIDLSGFDTSNVTTMNEMFEQCLNIRKLDLSSFDTSKVKQMYGLFSRCKNLEEINLSSFDTSNTFEMDEMFLSCSSLKALDLSNFDMSSVTSASNMFEGCKALSRIKTPVNVPEGLKIALPIEMTDKDGNKYEYLPNGNDSAESIELQAVEPSEWYEYYKYTLDTTNRIIYLNESKGFLKENVTVSANASIDGVDYAVVLDPADRNNGGEYSLWKRDVDNITEIRLEKGVRIKNNDASYLFGSMTNLVSIDLEEFDTSEITNMSGMFQGCGLEKIDFGKFDTSKVTDMSSMFSGCVQLKNIDLSGWDTSNVVNMNRMFNRCISLSSLDVSGLNTSSVTDMAYMFSTCKGLSKLDISTFDTHNVENMYRMFEGCSGLTELGLEHINTSKVKNMSLMFAKCINLNNIDIKDFDTSNVEDMSSLFNGCTAIKTVDISKFDTSNVTDMSGMFRECTALENINLGKLDTTKLKHVGWMFYQCSNLSYIDLTDFDTSNVENMSNMFNGCTALKTLDISKFDTSNVENMANMFNGCAALKTLDTSKFETSKVKKVFGMFCGCSSLTEIDLSSFDISKADVEESMLDNPYSQFLDGCESLEKITTPKAVNTSMSAVLPVVMYELIDGKSRGKVAYTDLVQAPLNTVLVSDKYALPNPDAGELCLDNLTYSFDNSFKSFGYIDPYRIPIESYKYLFGDNVKAQYYYKSQRKWRGNCMGFSGTSALMFDDDNGIYATTFFQDATKISDLTPTVSSNSLGIDITRFIEVMQISQKTEQIASDVVNNKIFTFDLKSGKRNLDAMYEQIKKSCSQNEPVVLAAWQGDEGHALLAYKTEEFSDTENRIYIYDSNKPEESVYVTLNRDERGNITSWQYDMGSHGIWGTDDMSALSYVPYTTINEVWKLRGKLGEAKNTACFNSKDFSIYDAEDNIVATVTNGVLNTDSSEIFMLSDELALDSVSEDAMITLVLPIDVYTIKNNDADLDNFHFEVVDNMQGMTVDTTADEVVLVVADDYGLNSVLLDAAMDDSYSISLDSCLADDIASVCVTGMGNANSDMVEVSQCAGEVNVENGIVSSLVYDGEEMITFTVSANAGQGGTIDPSGIKIIVKGTDQLYKIIPDEGYEVADVLVDGTSVGAVNEYLFSAVDKDHTIEARFFKNDMHMVVGEKQTIKLEKGKNPVKEWIVDNENIVKLSAKQKKSCKVTGLAEGIVCITGLDKNKEVVIQKYLRIEKPVLAEQVIRSGEEFSVSTFITGARDCRPTKYSSSKSSVLKIDKKTGTANAKKNGTAKVTVWYGNAKYTAVFDVKMPVISEKKMTVKMGETKTMEIANALEGASYRWESSKESVVTVSEEGVLAPVKKGKAKITMYYTINGKEYVGSSCTVTIKK